jgi:tetratricopeptide (TPR) repeat protein
MEKNRETILKRDDAFLCYITLLILTRQYDTAINLLSNHRFYVWEGDEIKVHDAYVDAHLQRGHGYFRSGKYMEALNDYKAALEFPDNLGAGEPYIDIRSLQVYYFIATAYEKLGKDAEAKEFYRKSVAVKHSWDKIGQRINWGEVCFYQALAYRKLSREDEAKQMLDEIRAFGRNLLKTAASLDFFAKFGEKQTEQARLAHGHYMIGLAHLGKEEMDEARVEFENVLKLNPCHSESAMRLSEGSTLGQKN